MSASQASFEKNNSKQAFVAALVTNGALLGVQVVAFTFMKEKLQRVYAPRSFLPAAEKRAPELPKGPWKWLPAIISIQSKDIIEKNGLDAYLYIRFIRVLIVIFATFTLVTWPILIPAVTIGVSTERDGLSQLSWANVPLDQQNRYSAHLLVECILTAFVLWLIRRELNIYVVARHKFLINEDRASLAQSRTVLITSLPRDVRTEKDLRRLLSFVPGGINRIWMYRDGDTLPGVYDRRLELCEMLEKAECHLIREALIAKKKENKVQNFAHKKILRVLRRNSDDDEKLRHIEEGADKKVEAAFHKVVRPTHRLGRWFWNEKVDTINWCKDEILKCNETLAERRVDIDKAPCLGAAFVQCNLQMGAHVLAQVVTHHEPLRMYKKYTDVAPEDIVWSNMHNGMVTSRLRYLTSWAAIFGLVVAWSFPVAFAGLLSNIDQLCQDVSWLAWTCSIPDVPQGIIQGLVPPGILAGLFFILPMLLRGIAWYQCIPRYTLISMNVYRRYFLLLVIHGFFVATLSSGLTASIPAVLNDPGSVVQNLAQNMPEASIFFLTYMVTTGFTGAASALLQLIPLVWHGFKRMMFGDTPRSAYRTTFVMPIADCGTILPRLSLMATIGMAYSVIAPVINGLALLSFVLLYIAWKYLFIWVFDQPNYLETGGLYYPMAINNLFVGLYIKQVCLAILFFLTTNGLGHKRLFPMGVIMVILVIITAYVHATLMTGYRPIINNLPVSLTTQQWVEEYERKNVRPEHRGGLLPDLFNRNHVRRTIRKTVRLPAEGQYSARLRAKQEFKRKEERLENEKLKNTEANKHDIDMLAGVLSPTEEGSKHTSFDEHHRSQSMNDVVRPTLTHSTTFSSTGHSSQNSQHRFWRRHSSRRKHESASGSLQRHISYPSRMTPRRSRTSATPTNRETGEPVKRHGFTIEDEDENEVSPLPTPDITRSGSPSIRTGETQEQIVATPGQASSSHGHILTDDEYEESLSDDEVHAHAFDHPSTYADAPTIWIPQDDLGLSKYLIEELQTVNILASDIGAFIDAEGKVDVTRKPPDEAPGAPMKYMNWVVGM